MAYAFEVGSIFNSLWSPNFLHHFRIPSALKEKRSKENNVWFTRRYVERNEISFRVTNILVILWKSYLKL